MLWSYLKRQVKLILMLIIFAGVFAGVFSLYVLPVEAVLYALLLCLVLGAVFFSVGYVHYLRRHRDLCLRISNPGEAASDLPRPNGALEADYQALLRAVSEESRRLQSQAESSSSDTTDYFMLWAHQIKTPMAAMNLLLQTSDSSENNALSAELFKIGEYVDMVLSYLRLGSESTDYVLRRFDLDAIVRDSIKKYARLFILKKISVKFEETHRYVLTDEKWLSFVIGQLLSNAIKYTPEGGAVRIYGDCGTLSISDSGIGIRAEDLPRVFEKGFTGYNGREDKKSTGIGLYLCRQVLQKLGSEMIISSMTGCGTIVRIVLPDGRQVVE